MFLVLTLSKITQSSRGEEDSREEKSEKTEERREGRGVREGIPRVERKRTKKVGVNRRTEDVRSGEACAESRRAEREGESKFSH